jgi:hypothetical protein
VLRGAVPVCAGLGDSLGQALRQDEPKVLQEDINAGMPEAGCMGGASGAFVNALDFKKSNMELPRCFST